MEVYLSGRWFSFDPRHNCWRIERTVIARGRDACDVPLTISFGKHTLEAFSVVTEEGIAEQRAGQNSLNSPRASDSEGLEWRLDGVQLSGGGFLRLFSLGPWRVCVVFSSPLALRGELLVIGADSVQLVPPQDPPGQGGALCAVLFERMSSSSLTCIASASRFCGILDEENHQEGDDGCACIYDELPGIAEVEQWS